MGADKKERLGSLLRSAAAETAGATLTVMLPTFNRVETLKEVLAALEGQDGGAGDFEVVVVDDGSTDGTADFLKDYAAGTSLNFTGGLMAENGGPAAARNAGLDLARGDVVIIIGDDIIPPPDFVGRQHHRTKFLIALNDDFRRARQGNTFRRKRNLDDPTFFPDCHQHMILIITRQSS